MENIYLKLYQMLNKQAPQVNEDAVQMTSPELVDLGTQSYNKDLSKPDYVPSDEKMLYQKILERAKKDKVITPYALKNYTNAMILNNRGLMEYMLGNTPKELKEKKSRQ